MTGFMKKLNRLRTGKWLCLAAAVIAVFLACYEAPDWFLERENSGSNGPANPSTNPGGGGTGCAISGYKTKTIGSQTWMAENLNCDVSGSKCYNNSQDNCNKYGRLYNWEAAKNACPSGWHLPSDAEWATLENAVGGSETAGRKLKSKTGWYNNGNGTDEYGFSALPGGSGNSDGGFDTAGDNGSWWSATEGNAGHAWNRYMLYDYESVDRHDGSKSYLFSVRCLQD